MLARLRYDVNPKCRYFSIFLIQPRMQDFAFGVQKITLLAPKRFYALFFRMSMQRQSYRTVPLVGCGLDTKIINSNQFGRPVSLPAALSRGGDRQEWRTVDRGGVFQRQH
jgi:hypothetical protein